MDGFRSRTVNRRAPKRATPAVSVQVLSLAFSLGYLFVLPAHPYPGRPIVKGLSIATLAILPWISRPACDRGHALLLSAALILSSIGDVFLDVEPERLFVYGLGAFLLAHLAYIALFARFRIGPRDLPSSRRFWITATLVYVVLISFWLVPGLGPLQAPVAVYICVITLMAATALISRFHWRAAAGALLFLTSDSLLAVAKFKTPFPARGYLIWATYYAAQYLIVIGTLCNRHR
jgi:uncharacterized membrane protein YhhN